MNLAELNNIARRMVAPGKGLLAADESGNTIGKRFADIKTENTEENRRDYREFMFRTDEAMKKHISGVILYDETIRQKAKDGSTLVSIIEAAGAIPGIKVDTGTTALAAYPGELITQGLDGLRERFAEYHKLGARFAKWRAVIDIADGIPTYGAVHANAQAMARYAALAQEAGIVPIIEPEVLMDGAHDAARCEEVTTFVHHEFFKELFTARVALEGIILKPNMIVAGKKSPKQAGVAEVAERTLRVLRRTTPAAVPGIAFLSGGQSDLDATQHLDAMNRLGGNPWPLTFSYGRALQAAPQKAWGGKAENVQAGKDAFAHRALMNFNAALGKWNKADDKAAA
jgi:fructose-bisphosphate aldolase class I